MCVIIRFAPNAVMPKEAFSNAVHNNWHSWGLVLKDGNGKTMLLRDCPEGGNNPETLWKLVMEDNKDCERFLHLRHTTKGSTSMDNTQPITVYNSDELQVYFFHNGTFFTFGSKVDGQGKSDTVDFCEQIIMPSLLAWEGPLGKSDYTDPVYQKLIVDKQWSGASTGLMVSNKFDPVQIGSGWSEFKQDDPKDGLVFVSNTQYFKEVVRGPFHEAQKEAKRKAEQERTMNFTGHTGNSDTGGVHRGVTNFFPGSLSRSRLVLEAMTKVFTDDRIDDPEKAASMVNVTLEEWYEFIEKEDKYTTTCVLMHLATMLDDVVTDRKKLIRDNVRLRERIQAELGFGAAVETLQEELKVA